MKIKYCQCFVTIFANAKIRAKTRKMREINMYGGILNFTTNV